MITRIEIGRSALINNVRVIRSLIGDSLFLAVVKSNAYGHGLAEVVLSLQGEADWFGVNSLQEARKIRSLDPSTPILVMGGFFVKELPEEEREFLRKEGPGTTLVLSSGMAIEELEEISPSTPFHVKVDTGMSRLGLQGEELEALLGYLKERPGLPWSGMMTHFANVEDVTAQDYALTQLNLFLKAREMAKGAAQGRELLFHAAASAAAMILPESRLGMVRIGISLYGLWPSDTTRISLLSLNGSVIPLKPVLKWITRVVYIKEVPDRSYVGYGCTYRTQQTTRLAVLPVGYYEGYERALSNRSHVILHGKRARVVGRVCMNMIMVDVTHIPDVKAGDEAILIGEENGESVTADELANLTSTINYEVVTRIQSDLPRLVVD